MQCKFLMMLLKMYSFSLCIHEETFFQDLFPTFAPHPPAKVLEPQIIPKEVSNISIDFPYQDLRQNSGLKERILTFCRLIKLQNSKTFCKLSHI